ncbi:MAG: radical SAM protein, partial [Eubacteriaceae bacterium]|nr:radical SAM protein [Eubacteriaceae bacterium]
MHRIETIEAGTPAEKSGIAVGDYLMAINGNQIKDVLDYMIFSTEEELRLDMCSAKGKSYTVLLQNLQGKPLGMGFASVTLDEEKKCQNQCVFCFIDQ